jgi:hypothetical protein
MKRTGTLDLTILTEEKTQFLPVNASDKFKGYHFALNNPAMVEDIHTYLAPWSCHSYALHVASNPLLLHAA